MGGWLGVNPQKVINLEGNLMACPLCPVNSLDPLGQAHCEQHGGSGYFS